MVPNLIGYAYQKRELRVPSTKNYNAYECGRIIFVANQIQFIFQLTENYQSGPIPFLFGNDRWNGIQKYIYCVSFVTRIKMEPVDIVQNMCMIMDQPLPPIKYFPTLKRMIVTKFPRTLQRHIYERNQNG